MFLYTVCLCKEVVYFIVAFPKDIQIAWLQAVVPRVRTVR